jgi:hypothetical protein
VTRQYKNYRLECTGQRGQTGLVRVNRPDEIRQYKNYRLECTGQRGQTGLVVKINRPDVTTLLEKNLPPPNTIFTGIEIVSS